MSQMSNWMEEWIGNHVIRGVSWTPPTDWYLALYTSDPTEADSGTEVSTGDWTNYARVAISRASGAWNAAASEGTYSGYLVDNVSAVDFGTATISTPPTVTHWGLRDASSGGNLWWYGALTASRQVQNGNPVQVNAGDLDLILAGAWANYAEEALLNYIIRASSLTFPTDWYVTLYTTDPTDADSGTEVSTGDWSDYAREAITRNTGSWNAATSEGGGGYVVDNVNTIDFGTATIVGSDPTITHWGLRSAAAAGNLWYYSALTASKLVQDGNPVRFNAGALDIIHR